MRYCVPNPRRKNGRNCQWLTISLYLRRQAIGPQQDDYGHSHSGIDMQRRSVAGPSFALQSGHTNLRMQPFKMLRECISFIQIASKSAVDLSHERKCAPRGSLSLREPHYPDLRDLRYPECLCISGLETILCSANSWITRIEQHG